MRYRLSVRAAAPTADSLELAYVDSDHGSILTFAGTVRGDTIRFAWSRDLGTRVLMVRREYTAMTPNSFATHTFMSPDSGRNWILVQQARYVRTR
jgi:hypothetical protein